LTPISSDPFVRSRIFVLLAVVVVLLTQPACFSQESTTGATVQMHKGRPCIFVDGKPLPLVAYSPTTLQPHDVIATKRFFAHDMSVFFLNVPRGKNAEDWGANPFWTGNRIEPRYLRPLDSPSIDDQARLVLEQMPNARFIIRFMPMEPKDWRDVHPEELFVDETGELHQTPSLASQQYLRDSAKLIESVIRFCETHNWSDRIIGYWTGHRVEGSHMPVIMGYLYDHSEVMRQRWRAFLKQKYQTDTELQTAWHNEKVTLGTVDVPSDSLRRPVPEVQSMLFWQPAAGNQPFRDYIELSTQLYHELFIGQAVAHHRATERRRVFIVDTLKQVMQGWENKAFFDPKQSWPIAYHDMLAGAGNVHAAKLLELNSFNGLITPHDYVARGMGGVYLPEGIVESTLLRNKLFLCEMDTRSYTARNGKIGKAENDAEFAAITWRNIAASQTGGYHSYWMDVSEDWFGSEGIHKIIHRQAEVLQQAISWPHENVPGIAVIIDDAAVFETNGNGRFANEAIMWEMKTGLARCGVPYRAYLLEDLALDNFPEHRVFYFPNLYKVDDERIELLRKKVFRNGHVVLWGPGSGISDGKTLSVEHAQKLTGFTFKMISANAPRRVLMDQNNHAITRDVRPGDIIGGPLAYGPLLIPTSGRSLGRLWTKGGINASGLSVMEHGQGDTRWTSVFTTAVPLPADLWRGLARHAGAHIYTQSNDIIHADRFMVALHTSTPGPRTIHLPEPARVIDVITGKTRYERTKMIEDEITASQTVIYRLEPFPLKN